MGGPVKGRDPTYAHSKPCMLMHLRENGGHHDLARLPGIIRKTRHEGPETVGPAQTAEGCSILVIDPRIKNR